MMQIVLIVFLGALTPAYGLGLACFNIYTVNENKGVTMACQWSPNVAHSWSFNSTLIAKCNANSASCTRLVSDSPLQVGRWDPKVSSSALLVPTGQERAAAGYVLCATDGQNSGCTVRVVHVTEATCNIYVDRSLWTVQIVCRVTKMYASDGIYRCSLPTRPGLRWQPSNSRSAGNLTTYRYMENNKEYQKGTCIFNFLAMPTSGGVYKGGVEFVPPTKAGFVKTPDLFIAPPTGPPSFVNCPIFINEGDDLRCTCTPAPSFPRATTKWSKNAKGQKAHMLLVRNVSKADIDTGFQCTQCWGNGGTHTHRRTYRPEVGGKNVTNCSQTWDFSKETWTVTFVCNVERMYSSDGRYICRWIYPGERVPGDIEGELSLFKTTIDGKVFQEGMCALRAEKPDLTTDGQHNYSLQFVPGDIPTGPDQFSALALDILQPGPPTLLNCPELVNASAINCTCQPAIGRPPAVVIWTIWNEKTEHTSGLLEIKNTNRSMDGQTYNCTQYWGGWSEKFVQAVNYTLRFPEEATTLPPITQEEIAVVAGIGAGFGAVWGTLAAMGQVCQVLSNAGWMPFLHMGSDEKDEKKEFEHSEDSSDAGPPSKLFLFCNFMCCGGAGVLRHLFLFCVSCGKRYNRKKKKKKKKVVQDDADSGMSVEQVPLTPTAVVVDIPLPLVDSVDSLPSGSHDAHLHEPPSLTSPASQEESLDTSVDVPKKAAFTDRYFAVASWLENPITDRAKEKKTSNRSTETALRAFHSSGFNKKKKDHWTLAMSQVTDGSVSRTESDVHTQKAEYAPDDDAEKSDQKANNSLIPGTSQKLSVPNLYASGSYDSSGSRELSFE